ncbi:MAG: hypothetical protein MZW92_31825 [Comamonadaceae bacterium]|nr:hypothetical protein [Comamonadaceae bacterium]
MKLHRCASSALFSTTASRPRWAPCWKCRPSSPRSLIAANKAERVSDEPDKTSTSRRNRPPRPKGAKMLANQGQAAEAVSLLNPISAAATVNATSARVDVRKYEGDLVFIQRIGALTGSLTLDDRARQRWQRHRRGRHHAERGRVCGRRGQPDPEAHRECRGGGGVGAMRRHHRHGAGAGVGGAAEPPGSTP